MDVGAGGKSRFARAGDDNRAYAVVGFVVGDGLVQLAHQLHVEGVQCLGTVQRNHADVGFHFVAVHHGGAR